MKQYMYLLWETPGAFAKMSPEDMQKILERYNGWFGKVAQTGRVQAGHKLTEEGGKWVTKQKDKISSVDGPYTETKEIIGGIFMVTAENYDDAVRFIHDCPALDFGRVEIRQIDPIAGG